MGSRQESAKPFDIRDYHQILSEFAITVKQLNSLVGSVDELLTSPKLETPLPVVFKLTDRMESLGETWMKEAFILGGALILFFFITLFVYRIVSQRIMASRKGQVIAAILLVVASACIYGYNVVSDAASSRTVGTVSDQGETESHDNGVFKVMVTPKKPFSNPTIQQEFPVRDETRFELKGPDGIHLVNDSSVELAAISALHDVPSIPAPSSISASKPKPHDSTAQVIKGGSGTPERPMHQSVPESRISTVSFSIHFESYRNPNLAKERVLVLKSLGLEAFSRRVDLLGKGIFHRVLVGTFENRMKATDYQVYLKKALSLGESRIISASAKPSSNIAKRSAITARGKAL